MKISRYIIILLALLCILPACTDLDNPPKDIFDEREIFGSENGIKSYLADLYRKMPVEDFRYTPRRMFNDFWIIDPFPTITGEALCNNQSSAETESRAYWGDAYKLIRDINYFLETLPEYKEYAGFTQDQIDIWTGEAYLIRGFTYFALSKRFGGVPLVDEVLKYPDQTIAELQIPRSSEDDVFMKVKEDMETAYSLLPQKNSAGRLDKATALGFKSRAMLFAGSIAKYNTVTLFDSQNNQLCGIPSSKAETYFKLAYDAAKELEGQYSLYKKNWKAGDKEAQYQNYVNMFFDNASEENIFVKRYGYPESVHGYDCYNVPWQVRVGGYSSSVNPTLDFVEMFDGLPKTPAGKIDVYDVTGKYNLYNNPMDFFANAEPRLRANVIFPGDDLKGETIEIWRGIYTGSVAGGISPLLPAGYRGTYEDSPSASFLVTSAGPDGQQTIHTLPDGTRMNAAGRSGRFYNEKAPALTGFSVRKYLNPNMPKELVLENRSDQAWIELRYAEILLNRAEAAFELHLAGKVDIDYQDDAFKCVNEVRERAGANLLASKTDLNDIDIVRTERKKELAFENKVWWDMRRWRTMDQEQNGKTYRVLMPFYAEQAGKWFFNDSYDEKNGVFTFDGRWYYQRIDDGDISKSPNLVQNPGY